MWRVILVTLSTASTLSPASTLSTASTHLEGTIVHFEMAQARRCFSLTVPLGINLSASGFTPPASLIAAFFALVCGFMQQL